MTDYEDYDDDAIVIDSTASAELLAVQPDSGPHFAVTDGGLPVLIDGDGEPVEGFALATHTMLYGITDTADWVAVQEWVEQVIVSLIVDGHSDVPVYSRGREYPYPLTLARAIQLLRAVRAQVQRCEAEYEAQLAAARPRRKAARRGKAGAR